MGHALDIRPFSVSISHSCARNKCARLYATATSRRKEQQAVSRRGSDLVDGHCREAARRELAGRRYVRKRLSAAPQSRLSRAASVTAPAPSANAPPATGMTEATILPSRSGRE